MYDTALALLRAYAPLTDVVGDRIYDRPLQRLPEGIDPLAAPLATPDAFDPDPPKFVRPSLVLSRRIPRLDFRRGVPEGWAADYVLTVAYYAPPGGEGTLRLLAVHAAAALIGKRLPMPNGNTGRIRNSIGTVGPEDAPEFPATAIMSLDTFSVSTIWRIP